VSTGWTYTADENKKVSRFLNQTYNQQPPKPSRLWVNDEMKKNISTLLNRPVKRLSYRYWQAQGKTVWILDEIGKERNITTAVVIKNQQVSEVKVLVYRESRGGEVQVPWFTEQFKSARANQNWQSQIDSISGATLSVNALKKQVQLALFLEQQLP